MADLKQGNFAEILDTERTLVLEGEQRYGAYYRHAAGGTLLLSRFVKSVDATGMIFVRFLSQLKKHHTLALFSTLRLHKVQSMMDLRQALEAGACAAYGLANPDPNDFAQTTEFGTLESTSVLTLKRYRWLEDNFPGASSYIKAQKALINQSTAHANIVYTKGNFRIDEERSAISAPFFDFEEEYFVRTDLWMIGGIALSLLDLFFGVNQKYPLLQFIPEFHSEFAVLAKQSLALQAEMQATERFQKIRKVAEDSGFAEALALVRQELAKPKLKG